MVSWKRLIHSAVPSLARRRASTISSTTHDVDLTPAQADNLVRWQLTTATPPYLTEEAFYFVGLTSSRAVSRKVHRVLVKHGLIVAAPPPAAAPSFAQPVQPVNTAAISKRFVRQLAVITVFAQRRLVALLFFWEEECTRWKLLAQEEAEILTAMDHGYVGDADLDVALRAVDMKRLLLPSLRAEATANISQGVGYELPRYNG